MASAEQHHRGIERQERSGEICETGFPSNVTPLRHDMLRTPAREQQRALQIELTEPHAPIPPWQVVTGVFLFCGAFWYGVYVVVMAIA